MRGGWLIAAALLLSGCTLGSDESLIGVSDGPAQAAGRYQLYVGGEGEPEAGATCLERGVVAESPVAGPILYCTFKDEGGGPPMRIDIVVSGATLVVHAPNRPRVTHESELRFLRLADGLYLAQVEDGSRYDLWIARIGKVGIELYALDCADFAKGTRPYSGGYGPPCEAISLDALRPGLKAYAGWIAEGRMPFAVLKRL